MKNYLCLEEEKWGIIRTGSPNTSITIEGGSVNYNENSKHLIRVFLLLLLLCFEGGSVICELKAFEY